MVEWCLPQDIDLEGVEFKSMASGSHKIQSDFMWVGLSCITAAFSQLRICTSIPSFKTREKNATYGVTFLHKRAAKLYLAEPEALCRCSWQRIGYALAAWHLPAGSFACGAPLVKAAGQLLSGVEFLLCVGHITRHGCCWGWQQRPRVEGGDGRTEAGRILWGLDLGKGS